MPDMPAKRGITENQLQDLLADLLAENVIPESAPLNLILRVHNNYKNNINAEFKSKVYDLDLGYVVDDVVPRFNFALDYVCVLKERDEIFFVLDNSKIVCIYDFDKQAYTSEMVYMILTSMLDKYNFEVMLLDNTAAFEEYVGIPISL